MRAREAGVGGAAGNASALRRLADRGRRSDRRQLRRGREESRPHRRPSSRLAGQKPQIVYKITTTTSPYVPSPLYKDGRLYLWNDTGGVTCLKSASGEVIWEGQTKADFYGSPICVNDKLYAMSKKGEVNRGRHGREIRIAGSHPLSEMTTRRQPSPTANFPPHHQPSLLSGKMISRSNLPKRLIKSKPYRAG